MNSFNNIPNKGAAPFDPGWNDPPPLSYNALKTTSTKPRNFLNKRVAFPLSGTTSSPAAPLQSPPMTIGMPPPIQPPAHPNTVHTEEINKNDTPTTDCTFDSESALKDVKRILLSYLEENSELHKRSSDIERRINVMEEMWTSGKLNTSVHIQMLELVNALQQEPTKADDIHRALMIDHVSAVGTWMPGIKQIIHSCIARTELLAIDKE